jgi:hypothetical protein
MVITVRRSFPWFPVALAIAWLSMMGLAIRDLAWFANVSPSFADRTRPAATASQARTASPVQKPSGAAPCAASAIAPVARTIH